MFVFSSSSCFLFHKNRASRAATPTSLFDNIFMMPTSLGSLAVTKRNRNRKCKRQECIVKIEFGKVWEMRWYEWRKEMHRRRCAMTHCYCHIFIFYWSKYGKKRNLLFHFVTFVSNAVLLFFNWNAHTDSFLVTHAQAHTILIAHFIRSDECTNIQLESISFDFRFRWANRTLAFSTILRTRTHTHTYTSTNPSET